jgi:hypothetical protein
MLMQNGLKIGSCLLAIVLLGSLTMRAGFAEENDSDKRGDAKASSRSAAPAAENPTTLDNQSAPRGDNDKKIEGEPGGKTPDGIDTRITVPPRRAGDKPGKDTKAKIESPALGNLHRRTFPATRPSNQTVRNAVGVPVPRHDSGERHDGQHPGYIAVPHGPAVATTGITGSPSASPTKPEMRTDRPAAIAKPIVRSSVANRGPINGTGLVHRGSGPSGIGGPAKMQDGINGTTIRPTH